MSEETKVPPEGSGPAKSTMEGSWEEVGRQFQALGQSLAQAVRTAWENEETQRRVTEMRSGLESMVSEVGKAIDDSLHTPQGEKVRAEAERTVESLRTAGEQTVQEVRPQLINALEQLNAELQKLANRLEQKPTPGTGEASEAPETKPGEEL